MHMLISTPAMAGIELGLALCGLYGHTTYFKSACLRLLIDLASRSAGSLKISVRHPVGRVRIEAVDLYVLQR